MDSLPRRAPAGTRPRERVEGSSGGLSRIVMKLLAKSAEDRYQTAAGVERICGGASTEARTPPSTPFRSARTTRPTGC